MPFVRILVMFARESTPAAEATVTPVEYMKPSMT